MTFAGLDSGAVRRLARIDVLESRSLRYDEMLKANHDGRTVLIVGELAQLRWRLRLVTLLKEMRAELFAARVAQVADIETRWFGD